MEGRSYSHVSNYYQLAPECLWVGQIRKGAQNVFHAPHSQQKHLQDLSCWIGMREEEPLSCQDFQPEWSGLYTIKPRKL